MMSFSGSSFAIPFPLDSSLGAVGSFRGFGEYMDDVVLGIGDGIIKVGIKNFSFLARGSSSVFFFLKASSSKLFASELREIKRLDNIKAKNEKFEESLKKILRNSATIRAQKQKMAEHEAKRKKEATIRITKANDPLNVTVHDKFRLKTFSFSEWLEVHSLTSKAKTKKSSRLSNPPGITKDLRLDILGTEPLSSIKFMMSFSGSSFAIPFPLDSSLGAVGSLRVSDFERDSSMIDFRELVMELLKLELKTLASWQEVHHQFFSSLKHLPLSSLPL
nr:hypothetical protein [Tanacetum cinerariifolium]